MLRRTTSVFVIISLLCLGVLVAGCCAPCFPSDELEKEIEKEIEKSIPKSPSDSKDDEDGSSEDVSGEDIKDVPRYPGSVRTESMDVSSGDNVSMSNTYEVDEDTAKVFEWYKDKMPSMGWKSVLTTGGENGGGSQTYENSDAICTVIVENVGEGETKIIATYATKL